VTVRRAAGTNFVMASVLLPPDCFQRNGFQQTLKMRDLLKGRVLEQHAVPTSAIIK
jgi:hypothetical protein